MEENVNSSILSADSNCVHIYTTNTQATDCPFKLSIHTLSKFHEK